MDGDFTNQELPPPAPDLQRLPEIESVKALHVRFRQPVQYAEGATRKEADEAIEFQVTASDDFPVRALSPALFVGETAVTEFKRIGKGRYRFVSYGRPQFNEMSPISIGWIGSGPPEQKATKLTFRLEGEETR